MNNISNFNILFLDQLNMSCEQTLQRCRTKIDNNEWKCIKSMVYKLYITVVQVILKGVKQHNIKRYNNTGAIHICAFL